MSGSTPAHPKPPATDAMQCRACGREERASEGYPCERCGTFVCLMCNLKGITLCRQCEAETSGGGSTAPA